MSPQPKPRRTPAPLDDAALKDMALRYVAKYATTRAKLRTYLFRKLRERGWTGDRSPDLEGLADRFAELGMIDDSAFAMSKARALAGRGHGKQRLAQQLRQAGVRDEDGQAALEAAEANAVAAALRFAQRRSIGPFAAEYGDRRARERALAAMLRAGHEFDLARIIVGMEPGTEADLINLCESYPTDAA